MGIPGVERLLLVDFMEQEVFLEGRTAPEEEEEEGEDAEDKGVEVRRERKDSF